ncbi:Nucleoporin GLE1 [Candida viswanathii]|uniref:mRNA export factor GLE1 n=1 Tax=Candida viswanathii TaxID=5486 RepID=A0A367XLU0_9ASCO|nr:Nucleoporin GLE1 [Candida viswanathii]
MRYGLPDDFEVAVDITPEPVSLSLIKAEPEPVARSESEKVFQEVCRNIESSTSALIELKEQEMLGRRGVLNLKISAHYALADANISYLAENFESKLQLQSNEVEDVIRREKERRRLEAERIRREEEERKRREEEERKRKEDEERRRAEDERKRKEQEERDRKAEEERKRKEAEEEAKKQEELKAKREKEELEQKKKEEMSNLATTNASRIEKEFLKYKQDILDIKNNTVLKLNENKDLKKSVNQHKRKINPKFGQLSNSISQLRRIGAEVVDLIKATKVDALVFNWTLNFVAKAIIDQAETEVIVRPNSALPLAHLAYTILHEFQEFAYYLDARFIKKCPYIIGYTCAIDSEEGRKRMGWKRTTDNKWEDDAKYDERMGGITTVWAVMTRLTDYNLKLPLYSMAASWTFLARIANLNQLLLSNVHFAILGNWWEACAAQFVAAYGKQSEKLMYVIVTALTDVVANRKLPSAARLRILGEDWVKTGRIESLKEMER